MSGGKVGERRERVDRTREKERIVNKFLITLSGGITLGSLRTG